MRSRAGLLACLGVSFQILIAPAGGSRLVAQGVHPDFNGDGHADLAIGVPQEELHTSGPEGAVSVIYGSAAGLTPAGDQLWHQDKPGILDAAESGDAFGSALAWGDFDGDGFDDLAVGVPGEDAPGVGSDVGAVNVIYGSAAGLTSTGSQLWTQDSPDVPDQSETNGRFGSALAHGDFDGDGFDDLAIGVPGEGPPESSGAVDVLYGTADGLAAARSQLWTQLQDAPEAFDQFGRTLAAGDFDDDGFDDLAIGAPAEAVGASPNAGAVSILYGSAAGLTDARNQLWTQDAPGVQDVAEADDEFGNSLVPGDFDGDGRADLAIGAFFEDVGTVEGAGAVNVLYGSPSGLSADRDQFWHQDKPGVLDRAEAFDLFGVAVAAGDFNDDGISDLAIGAHGENIEGPGGTILNAGAVNVLYGTPSGLAVAGNQLWTQDSPDVVDGAEPDDRFGYALTRADFNGDHVGDLAIGSFEGVGSAAQAGAVNILYGSPTGLGATGNQLWSQDSPGIKDQAEEGDRFGTVLPAR